MLVLDTNVLIEAANDRAFGHASCRRLLEDCRRGTVPWYLTWSICYEFLRVVTHRSVLAAAWPAGKAWGFLEALFASPSFGFLVPGERHASVAAEVFGTIPDLAGNILHDAHIAVLMREHGIKTIYSRDTDFHRFPFLEQVDPLA